MEAEDVRAQYERYRDAWSGRDVEAIMAAVAPDVVLDRVTAGERIEGADAVRAYVEAAFARWPDLALTEHALHVARDVAVSEWTVAVTDGDGRRLAWEGVDVVTFRDGLVVRDAAYSGAHAPRVVG
jgi:ketosteroid isomerase-like protein